MNEVRRWERQPYLPCCLSSWHLDCLCRFPPTGHGRLQPLPRMPVLSFFPVPADFPGFYSDFAFSNFSKTLRRFSGRWIQVFRW